MTTISTDIDVRQTAALAIKPGQEMWTDKQRAALATLGIRNASPADLAVFMHYCQKTGLDPFSRQIYGIMRRENVRGQWVEKFTIQVGIDGFRVIRDRIAERRGVSVEYEDSRWYDGDGIAYEVWLRDEPPAACGFAVLKDGKRFPAVVRYSAFAQMKDGQATGLWGRMGAEQLEKCAEAKALRRAFPHDLGGLYIEDEMPDEPGVVVQQAPARLTAADITGTVVTEPQSGNGHAPEPAQAAEPTPAAPPEPPQPNPGAEPGSVSKGQLDALWAMASTRFGYTKDDKAEWRQACEKVIGRKLTGGTTGNLSSDEADSLAKTFGDLADRAAFIAFLAEFGGKP